MVDSVKNYGITGVGSVVELGKGGPKIDDKGSKISFSDNTLSTAMPIAIAEGTNPEHAVTAAQTDSLVTGRVSFFESFVNYNDGNVDLANISANATIHSVTVETVNTWTGADSNTNITVGDDADPDRLFAQFDPTVQSVDETNYVTGAVTTIRAYVTQGNASAGKAKIRILYSGAIGASPSATSGSPISPAAAGGSGSASGGSWPPAWQRDLYDNDYLDQL